MVSRQTRLEKLKLRAGQACQKLERAALDQLTWEGVGVYEIASLEPGTRHALCTACYNGRNEALNNDCNENNNDTLNNESNKFCIVTKLNLVRKKTRTNCLLQQLARIMCGFINTFLNYAVFK